MNLQATNAFVAKTARAADVLATLQAHLDNHFEVDADQVNWGHVGAAAHLEQKLNELAAFLGLEVRL